MQGPLTSRKTLIGGLVLLCCALVVLTLIASPLSVSLHPRSRCLRHQLLTEFHGQSNRSSRTVLAGKKAPWEEAFGWYAEAPGDSEIGLVARFSVSPHRFLCVSQNSPEIF